MCVIVSVYGCVWVECVIVKECLCVVAMFVCTLEWVCASPVCVHVCVYMRVLCVSL